MKKLNKLSPGRVVSPRFSWSSIVQWFDAGHFPGGADALKAEPEGVDLVRCVPFALLHLGCLGVWWVGWSWTAVGFAVAAYVVRMFAVTAAYHRYFSHKSFKTTRIGQFLLALWAGTAVQRGPLWWAAHHRHHHRHSDHDEDAHSPHVHGFWWSHMGWITSRRNFPTDIAQVPDLARFPELIFLDRFDVLVPAVYALGTWGLGRWLEVQAPTLGVTGPQLLVWGFFISTTVLFHGTSCINSLAHLFGRRRFATEDDSRNSFLLACVTLGEGWHNNHHRYQASTRQGFYWWEIDPTYYLLKAFTLTGLIWGLKPVPRSIYDEAERTEPLRTNTAAAPLLRAGGRTSAGQNVAVKPTEAVL